MAQTNTLEAATGETRPFLGPTASIHPCGQNRYVATVREGGALTGYLRNDEETGTIETVPYALADMLTESSAGRLAARFNGGRR